jgi:hypothetical protein
MMVFVAVVVRQFTATAPAPLQSLTSKQTVVNVVPFVKTGAGAVEPGLKNWYSPHSIPVSAP